MKNKKILRVFIALIAVLIMTTGFSVTVFAYVDETETEAETEPETTAEETKETTEPVSLTPDGNLTLVDDLSGEESEDKQFITVVTKNGNYFYLIIDRASNSENVYFLNMVDEEDLYALLEDTDGISTSTTGTAGTTPVTPEPEVTSEPDTSKDTATETEPGGGIGGTLLIVLIVAALGGGAFYYFKVLKPKQSVTGGTELDEFDFEDEDESEYISDGETDTGADEEQEDEE